MSDTHAGQVRPESGDANASDTTTEATTGAENADPTQGTPPLDGAGQRPGQTETDAPDDASVPKHDEDHTD